MLLRQNKMTMLHKNLLILVILFFVNVTSFALTYTAIASADWNLGTTWDQGAVPTNADDVVIPANYSVTVPVTYNSGNLTDANFASLTVNGELTVANNINLVAGRTITVTGDMSLGGDYIAGNSANVLSISGFFEANGSISAQQLSMTVNESGVCLVHTNISGTGAGLNLYNNGLIVIDNSITMNNTSFYNYETGKMLVYGDFIIDGGSQFFNYAGFLQCNNFYMQGGVSDIRNAVITPVATGTVTATIGNSTVTGSSTTFLSDLQVGDIILTDNGVLGSVSSITSDTELELSETAENSTLNKAYSISLPGTIIVLETLYQNTNAVCPGCSDYTIGNFYYDDIIGHLGSYCGGGTLCADWIANQNSSQEIKPGKRFWVAADFIGTGDNSNGDPVVRWFDLSNQFGFKLTQPVEANAPLLQNDANNVNYNPVISFDETGGSIFSLDLDGNNLFATTTGLAIFAVVAPKDQSGGGGDQFVLDYGLYPSAGYGIQYSDANARGYLATSPGGKDLSVTGHGRGAAPSLIAQYAIWGVGGSQELFVNGTSVASQASSLGGLDDPQIANAATATAGTGPFTIGKNSIDVSTEEFDGNLAEMIICENINTDSLQSIASYLAIKYGITLPSDYLAFDVSKVIYDVDATYTNCIAGIGREDLNFLHQRQSKSLENNAVLTITTDAFVNVDESTITTRVVKNSSYLIWGHDGASAVTDRVYKITSTNFQQTVNMKFEIAGLDPADLPDLVIAGDEGFGSDVSVVSPTSYADPVLRYDNVYFNNNNTSYCTFLKPETVNAPGVGIGTTTIHPTAELHVYSLNQGVLINSMTTANMNSIASPENGLLIFNTDINSFMYYNGTNWQIVGNPAKSTTAELQNQRGRFLGELRYNTTNNFMYYWDNSAWQQINNTADTDPTNP